MGPYRCQLVIVETRSLQQTVIKREAQGLDEIQAATRVGTQADDVARIRSDLRFDENNVHIESVLYQACACERLMVLPMAISINNSLTVPDAELQWAFSRSGGPGGQHANKTNSRAELTWDLMTSEVLTEPQRRLLTSKFGTDIRVVVDDERSQLRNREIAQERLAERVREALRPVRKRRATKPTRGSQRRRIEGKRKNSQRKQLRRKPGRDD